MKTALGEACTRGFTRIELGVRVDNVNAKRLYRRLGFVEEGINRNKFLIDGTHYHSNAMTLLLDDKETSQQDD